MRDWLRQRPTTAAKRKASPASGLAAEVQYFESDTALGRGSRLAAHRGRSAQGVPRRKYDAVVHRRGRFRSREHAARRPRILAWAVRRASPAMPWARSAPARYWTVDGAFLWHVADILPILSQALYGGITLEGGRVYERVDPVPNGPIYGGSVYPWRAHADRNNHDRRRLGKRLASGVDHAGHAGWPRIDPQPTDVPLMVSGPARCRARYGSPRVCAARNLRPGPRRAHAH